MSSLVLDEWLWSDLWGDNGTEKQKESLEFIAAVYRKCDCLVTVRESKFRTKGWALLKYSDVTRRDIARFVSQKFLTNTSKLKDLPSGELPSLDEGHQKLVKELAPQSKTNDARKLPSPQLARKHTDRPRGLRRTFPRFSVTVRRDPDQSPVRLQGGQRSPNPFCLQNFLYTGSFPSACD